MNQQIRLVVNQQQLQVILNGLGRMPLLESMETFQSISMQAQSQLTPLPPPPPGSGDPTNKGKGKKK